MGTMERLVKLKEYVDTNNIPCDFKGDTKVINELLKRVSELEFEVERLTCDNESLSSNNSKLAKRLLEAIEYIEKHTNHFSIGVNKEISEFDEISTNPKELLSILRGEENE